MAAKRSGRLRKVASEFSLGINTIREFLVDKGFDIGSNPNAKITGEMYSLLEQEFQSDKSVKEASEKIALEKETAKKERASKNEPEEEKETKAKDESVSEIKEESAEAKKADEKPPEKEESKADETIKVEHHKPKVLGKVDLEPKKDKQGKAKEEEKQPKKAEPKEEKQSADIEKSAEIDNKSKEETKASQPESKSEKTEKKPEEKKTSSSESNEDKSTSDKASDDKKEKKVEEKKTDAEEAPKAEEEKKQERPGLKVHGKIELDQFKKKKPESKSKKTDNKKSEETASDKKEQKDKSEERSSNKENKKPAAEAKKSEKPVEKEVKEEAIDKDETIKARVDKLKGPTVVGKIELPKKKVASSKDDPKKDKNFRKKRKKRKRIKKDDNKATEQKQRENQHSKRKRPSKKKRPKRQEPSEEDIQKKMKETLKRLEGNKSTSVKHRKNKRKRDEEKVKKETEKQEAEKNTLKVTEFVTASELANMLGVDVNQVIKTCMSLGLFVSINQRLDAETITVVAEEFNFEVEFVSAEVIENISVSEVDDKEEDYVDRSPIVTVMGHVDHGKTSLLDFIRHTNVIAGESGGITQHIGAYEVEHESGNTITFLDTPGHEAFTAMRARGSKITDIAVIVIAADDRIMPQTKEAINHAQAADVPIVFAINKIDRPHADPEKIKEQLAQMNLLVEDWGGKYQSQDISAKQGTNVDELLEKIILESELLELKGNPTIPAKGVVLEASLDKGRGYVAKLLVQNGSLKIGDTVLAGTTYGRVKAMFNERNKEVNEVGPSQPALVLGLHNAPQAGDSYQVMLDEKEAKSIANKREQLQREQGVRTQKHITLDEIGRRLAIGDFQELNIIVKGDVDGSVEALADSLIKLSTKEIQVNVIHKSVGQVNEADIMLAAASDAIIVAFQVRPSLQARKLAETEQIDIRTYSIIYKAIEEVKDAMEGMLSPDVEEKTVCTVEVRDVFKITKVGQIAGCYVLDGVITRNTNIRVIRDGIVVYTGKLGSLKRFKDDVKEVKKGYECGLNIENFNDIKVGDIIEGYEEIEVKRTLE